MKKEPHFSNCTIFLGEQSMTDRCDEPVKD